MRSHLLITLAVALTTLFGAHRVSAQVAVIGEIVHTMDGPPLEDGIIVITDGKIAAVGRAGEVRIPDGHRVLRAAVVTPGLIDAHTVVGLAGQYNYDHDQDQLERSSPIQPELRAIDAYNAHERLVGWLRDFGITTIHTGHAPGELMSGQTMIAKTTGNTADEAAIVETAAVASTLAQSAQKRGGSPGTRGKMMAMLRAELLEAQAYLNKRVAADDGDGPAVNLRMETLARVLRRELPLLVTANRSQDIATALRLKDEFEIEIWLDMAAEAYLLIEEIKQAQVPVIIHPTMYRATGETENLSFETAAKLINAGIPVAMQSGYESYVPKTRVVLFEAGWAAANGLTFEQALATITTSAASILGISERVGSIELGKDGDLALFDGDPFEYTSHCIATVIEGEVVSEIVR